MASQAPNMLPLLYNGLEPLDRVAATHAIPVTVDEFAMAQRHYPIVFSVGDAPVPICLMGLHEGTNTFFDAAGVAKEPNIYVPAYLRRFPFLLARLREDSDELSLCFDPSSGAVGEFDDGEALFVDGEPSPATQAILQFCEQFEQAGHRTQAFMADVKESGLLMDGEVAIQPEGAEQPFIYRGFQMVDEEKFRKLRGDELRKLNENGALPLIFAHLFSLAVIREIFGRQVQQGKGPVPARQQPEPADA